MGIAALPQQVHGKKRPAARTVAWVMTLPSVAKGHSDQDVDGGSRLVHERHRSDWRREEKADVSLSSRDPEPKKKRVAPNIARAHNSCVKCLGAEMMVQMARVGYGSPINARHGARQPY